MGMNARRAVALALRTLTDVTDRIGDCVERIADQIDKGDEEVFEVEITKRDVNGKGIEGKVASPVSTVYVRAKRVGYVEWEPIDGEKKDTGDRVELPSCFTLRHDAIIALEDAR
jgi:hypothetical protein